MRPSIRRNCGLLIGWLVMAGVAASPVWADTGATTPPEASAGGSEAATAPKPPADELTLRMMDDSVISGKLLVKSITVETPYGTLEIPVAAVRSIIPGLDSHTALAQQIADYINKMGSDVYADREAAQTALLKLGPAVRPEVAQAAKTAEAEKQTRLQAVLAAFDDQAEDSDSDDDTPTPVWIHGDAVTTPEFTVVGHIAQQSFDLQSPYGELTIKLADLQRAYRPAAAVEDVHKSVQVTGTDNLVFKAWATSGVMVSKGDKVEISADGKITLSPWGQNAISGPDGMMNYGQYPVAGGQIGTGGLIGRIGTSGSPFKVGSKDTFTADRAGKLMFAIAIQGEFGNQQFPGAYTVKINVHKK